MGINNNQVKCWKQDVAQSIDLYNQWFLEFAPRSFRQARNHAIECVENAMLFSEDFTNISVQFLKEHPDTLSILRMATAPPLARDRLVGLSQTSSGLIKTMEDGKLPARITENALNDSLAQIINIISFLLDKDIFPWFAESKIISDVDRHRSASIIADRVCGSIADPIIRNSQEERQLKSISDFLEERGYKNIQPKEYPDFENIPSGTFAFHYNILANISQSRKLNQTGTVKIPIDIVIQRKSLKNNKKYPLLIECKSAGDFANTNKRRKEEAIKITQLRETYGNKIEYILFLCGYFDCGYLGYEAAEGIDWIWEHRLQDLEKFGI